ncbi:MAG: transporter [Deltaproteobacteria bacterium]|nr:transporter [Deltaproteobacteria bacterium]
MYKKIIICLYIKTLFITLFPFAHASNTGVVLEKDQKEFKFFSSIYTQTKAFDSSGSKIDEGKKTSYWSNYFSFYKGITSDINWGFQFNIKSVKTSATDSSALNAIQFSSQSDTRFGLTSFGPQFKWKPVEDNNDLSLSISFSVPLKTDLDGKVSGRPYLDSNGWKLNSRIYYNYSLNDAVNLFCETGFDYIFDTNANNPIHSFSTPVLFSSRSWNKIFLF